MSSSDGLGGFVVVGESAVDGVGKPPFQSSPGCGAAPVPASSGRTHRHRLNRGGDRHANNALYIVVINLPRHDPRTRAERRTQEGLSKPEIIRCLKRYDAREIHRVLVPSAAAQKQPAQPLDSA